MPSIQHNAPTPWTPDTVDTTQANLFGLGDESFDFNNSFGQDDDFMNESIGSRGLQDFGDLRDPSDLSMDRSPASLDTFDMPNAFDLVAQQSATVFPAPSPSTARQHFPPAQKTRQQSSHSLDMPEGAPAVPPFNPEEGLSPDTITNLRKTLEATSPASVPAIPPQQPRQRSPRAAGCAEFKPAQKSDETRGKYKCGRCGQIKVNHICPFATAQPRNADAQTDDPRRPVRTNDRDKYVAVTPKVDAMTDDELTPRPAPSADGDHSFRERTVKVGTFVPAIAVVDEDGPGKRSHRRTASSASTGTVETLMDTDPPSKPRRKGVKSEATTPRPGPPTFVPHPWAAAFASATKAGPPSMMSRSSSSLDSTASGPAPALAFPPYNPAAFAAACAARGIPPPPPFFAGLPPRPFFAAGPLPPGAVPLPPGVVPAPPPRGMIPLPPRLGGFRAPALMGQLAHLTPAQLQALAAMPQVAMHARPPPGAPAPPRPPPPVPKTEAS